MRSLVVTLLLGGFAAVATSQPTTPAKFDPKLPFAAVDPGGHAGEVYGVAFSPDMKSVFTASADRTVRTWDLATGEAIRVIRLPVQPGAGGPLFALALSADGKTLAVAGATAEDNRDGSPIYVIDVATGRVLRAMAEHTETVAGLAFALDGKRLASASLDRTARVWDVSTGRVEAVLRGHTNSLSSIAFSPDGTRVATSAREGAIRIWPATGGKSELTLADRGARSVAWSPNGKYLAGGNGDGTVTLWDAQGKQLGRHDAPAPTENIVIQFTPDGSGLLCAGTLYDDPEDKKPRAARLLDAANGREVASIGLHTGTVTCAAVSADGTLAVTGGGPLGEAIVWRTFDGSVVRRLQSRGAAVAAVGWSEDGRTIAWGHLHKPWDPQEDHPLERTFHLGDLLQPGPAPEDATKFGRAVHTSKGRTVTSFVERVRVFDENDDISAFNPNAGLVSACTWLGDDLLVVAADRGLFLVDPTNGKALRRFTGPSTRILSLAPAADGITFLTGGRDQAIRVWRADRGRPILSLLPAGDEWIAWTEEGLYTCSPGGERLIGWQADESRLKPGTFTPSAGFRPSLYHHDVVRHVLGAGNTAAAFEAAKVKRPEKLTIPELLPPTVEITSATGLEVSSKFDVSATAKPTAGRPVTALRLSVDGRPYQGPSGVRPMTGLGEAKATWSVDLSPGPHTLVALADSSVSRGTSAPVNVRVAGSPGRPALYVLAIGVNDYPEGLKLKCAAADADAIAKAFRDHGAKAFRSIETKVLKDAEATKAGLEAGIAWLQEKTAPGYLAILAVSGRGDAVAGGEYVLLAHGSNPKDVLRTGVPAATLTAALSKIRGTVLVLLDVARPRKAGADDLVRELLADDCGAAVIAAARGSERAVEEPGAALGYFTQAVVDGLAGAADADKDGVVWLHELEAYVSARVKELSTGLLTPVVTRPPGVRSIVLMQK
jgi:WD40 repeat protein